MTTIRLKLLKIGAVVLRNTRRVRFLLSSAYPLNSCFSRWLPDSGPHDFPGVLPRHVDKQWG